jgi:hypothetical protein
VTRVISSSHGSGFSGTFRYKYRIADSAWPYRPLPQPRAAAGLQAHPPLRAARAGAQQARIAAARAALEAPRPVPAVVESVAQFMQRIDRLAMLACPHCGCGHFVSVDPIPPLPAQCQPRAPP